MIHIKSYSNKVKSKVHFSFKNSTKSQLRISIIRSTTFNYYFSTSSKAIDIVVGSEGDFQLHINYRSIRMWRFVVYYLNSYLIDYLTERLTNPQRLPKKKTKFAKGRVSSNTTSETSIWRNSWIELPLLARIPSDDLPLLYINRLRIYVYIIELYWTL